MATKALPKTKSAKIVKSAKKPALKTSVKTATPVQRATVNKAPIALALQSRIRKSYVISIIVILALGALLYAGRGLLVVAVVNGQPISRLSVMQAAEKQAGKQILEMKIQNTLIEQAAKNANISISEKEIDDTIKTLEAQVAKQGSTLDQALALKGLTRDDLREQIKTSKIVEAIVGKNIKVTDKEITDYIDKNKDSLPQDQNEAQLRKSVATQLKSEKLQTQGQAWYQSMQNKAKITYFVQY